MFDFEFNRLLTAIAKRTSAVTVILDCCHSTGITREEVRGGPGSTARCLDFSKDLGKDEPLRVEAEVRQEHCLGGVDDCQVVAACLNHELAREDLGADGVRHGLLTRALVTLLGEVDASEIRSVPWSRIWQRMRDRVETANPN